jgi:hypothetical protein
MRAWVKLFTYYFNFFYIFGSRLFLNKSIFFHNYLLTLYPTLLNIPILQYICTLFVYNISVLSEPTRLKRKKKKNNYITKLILIDSSLVLNLKNQKQYNFPFFYLLMNLRMCPRRHQPQITSTKKNTSYPWFFVLVFKKTTSHHFYSILMPWLKHKST